MKVSGVKSLSLKGRFAIVFSALMVLAILCCALLILEQHRTALHGADLAVQGQEEIITATELRDVLWRIDSRMRAGEYPAEQIIEFRDLAQRATARQPKDMLAELSRRFTSYVDVISAVGGNYRNPLLRDRYDQVRESVVDVIQANQASTFMLAEKLRQDQYVAIRTALVFLTAFIVMLLVAGFKIIAIITQPLFSLVNFLDSVNVEDDIPSSVPGFNSNVPEVQHVARSFEQLLARLRGYRTLNVRRLLIEKRRADIVAASITDGIFLLRNEEVLYVNPVGEKILGNSFGKSLNLSLHKTEPGPHAILSAVSRSMPAEFVLESGDRKNYYLIQAYSIDDQVIEQAEHSVLGPMEELLDRFQANVIVVAQDVTLVRESQEAKKHFLGTLSHEIKTPVTSLTMATRLLKRTLDQIPNPQHRALISTCVDDVERLRGLLEDLLTVSRFETLTQRMEVQSVDLGKLIRHSVQSFQFQAKERNITLTCKTLNNSHPGKPIFVPIDATKISWALSNLMINALRHTPPNGEVETELSAFDEWIEFRVRDTGPGIERNRQSRIFDKFNPFYDLRVARTGGAGVGLAIAREIVVAHGGKIWVSSDPKHGAEFCFTLPLKKTGVQFMDESIGRDDDAEKISMGLKNQIESTKGASRGTTSGG